jgi:hypothetical protein
MPPKRQKEARVNHQQAVHADHTFVQGVFTFYQQATVPETAGKTLRNPKKQA